MPGLSGVPNRAFPTTGRLIHEASVPPSGSPTTIDIVPAGQQTIQPAASFDFSVTGNFQIFEIGLDVPLGMTATLSVDGRVIIATLDGQGFIGARKVGDLAAGTYMQGRALRITGTNGTGSVSDVRAWIGAVS